jgi:hypothetical protein
VNTETHGKIIPIRASRNIVSSEDIVSEEELTDLRLFQEMVDGLSADVVNLASAIAERIQRGATVARGQEVFDQVKLRVRRVG